MNYKSHLLFGFLFFLLVLFANFKFNFIQFNLLNGFICILIFLIYSVMPDIDHRNSNITWLFVNLSIVGLGAGILQYLFFNSPRLIIFSFLILILLFIFSGLSHRGVIHSIFSGILFSLPLILLFGWFYFFVALVSWYSHLLGDGYLLKIF